MLYDYIRWPDGSSRFIYISPKCKEIFEYDSKHILANRNLLWEMVHPEDVKRLRQEDLAANQAQTQFQSDGENHLAIGENQMDPVDLNAKADIKSIHRQCGAA